MKTKSFRKYAEKRLGKDAVDEIEVEALEELESIRRENVISNFEYFCKYMVVDVAKGLLLSSSLILVVYGVVSIIKRFL